MTVEHSQEEGLRTASRKIDTMIKQFEENYAVRDKQDVLAMCALQFASQLEQNLLDKSSKSEQFDIKIHEINEKINAFFDNKIRS